MDIVGSGFLFVDSAGRSLGNYILKYCFKSVINKSGKNISTIHANINSVSSQALSILDV